MPRLLLRPISGPQLLPSGPRSPLDRPVCVSACKRSRRHGAQKCRSAMCAWGAARGARPAARRTSCTHRARPGGCDFWSSGSGRGPTRAGPGDALLSRGIGILGEVRQTRAEGAIGMTAQPTGRPRSAAADRVPGTTDGIAEALQGPDRMAFYREVGQADVEDIWPVEPPRLRPTSWPIRPCPSRCFSTIVG